MEFENGAACTAVFTGHGRYNSRELVHGFTADQLDDPGNYGKSRRILRSHQGDADWETAQKRGERYGADRRRGDQPREATRRPDMGWVLGGPLIASYEHADVKISPRGLIACGDDKQWEIPFLDVVDCRDYRLRAFQDSIANDKPLSCDGRWGRATVEVLLGVDQSGRERREIFLEQQVAYVE